jgi:uncharacterized protein (TIGR02145 family)
MKKILATLAVIAIIFSCKKKDHTPPPTTPLVKTAAITNNGGGNIVAGGSIVSDGGASVTKSGIAWSQGHATPSITDSIVESTTTTGAFTININGIDFGKTYYFRAYATNSAGTGYGDVVTLTTSNDSVRFTYNGQSVTFGIIVSPTTGKKWLDRNIGAKQVATAFNDYLAYGDLFQWGRPGDGHQLINWISSTVGTAVNGMTGTIATSDNPAHGNFIDATASPTLRDWRDNNNTNRWNTTQQGPCPSGWHVPTKTEWSFEISNSQGGTATNGGIKNVTDAHSILKLTASGYRLGFNSGQAFPVGTIAYPGVRGIYWASSVAPNGGGSYGGENIFIYTSSAEIDRSTMCSGYSVRCIKN